MDNSFKEQIKKAQEELAKKPIQTIEYESAVSWGARAYVSFVNFNKNKDFRWYEAALDYYHEFVEHSALSEGKNAESLKEIKAMIEVERKKAQLTVKKKSFV